MDIEDIQSLLSQLADMMKTNKLTELEIEQNGLRIHLKKEGDKVIAAPVDPAAAAAAPAVGEGPVAADAFDAGYTTITSPMVGTLYRTPSPDADHFIEIGDTVTDDTVVCIIEAMKVFNEIRAECEGKVVDILVGNGEAVEYGQPLFLVDPTA